MFPPRALFLALALGLSACALPDNDLAEPPPPLGDFVLEYNVVVADNMERVPISREATADEWEEVMTKAIVDRLGPSRYDGTRMYHLGTAINAYALAPPGVPVVAAPKSVLVITVNIWDDASQQKLNPKPKQIAVFEELSADTVIGSGLTRNKKAQMEALSYQAVKKIQDWMVRNPQWFTDNPVAVDNTENDPDPLAALLPDAQRTEPTAPAAAAPPGAGTAPAAAAPPAVATTPLPAPTPVPAN